MSLRGPSWGSHALGFILQESLPLVCVIPTFILNNGDSHGGG